MTRRTAAAYVDGSYMESVKGIYGFGVYFLFVNYETRKYKPISFNGSGEDVGGFRNIAGECEAAMQAIAYALQNDIQSLVIYHDYMGIEKWANRTWNANKSVSIGYRDFVAKAREKGMEIDFVKVKSHSGDTFNECADRLARQAVMGEVLPSPVNAEWLNTLSQFKNPESNPDMTLYSQMTFFETEPEIAPEIAQVNASIEEFRRRYEECYRALTSE